MTKLRTPETFQDAAMDIVQAIGADIAAKLLLCAQRTVRNWTDPDMEVLPQGDQMVALDAAYVNATGRQPPFLRSYIRQLRERMHAKAMPAGDLLAEALDVPAAAGQFAECLRRVRHATSPGGAVLTKNEGAELLRALKAIERECQEAARAIRGVRK